MAHFYSRRDAGASNTIGRKFATKQEYQGKKCSTSIELNNKCVNRKFDISLIETLSLLDNEY